MKTDPNDLAYPTFDSEGYIEHMGMSKRELFSAMALQGILANAEAMNKDIDLTQAAVIFADDLIEELNKDKEK